MACIAPEISVMWTFRAEITETFFYVSKPKEKIRGCGLAGAYPSKQWSHCGVHSGRDSGPWWDHHAETDWTLVGLFRSAVQYICSTFQRLQSRGFAVQRHTGLNWALVCVILSRAYPALRPLPATLNGWMAHFPSSVTGVEPSGAAWL